MKPRFSALVADGRKASFDVTGIDLCVINSMRRAIMAEVPTAAFSFDPTKPGEGVAVLRNTSSLHNELVGNRVSLVPVCLDANQLRNFDPVDYKCVLKVKNTGNEVLSVTSADFEVFDRTGAKLAKGVRDALFPPCPVTGDHILLLRLKPDTVCDGNGEEVHIECTPSLGVGRQHARWSPVSRCFFRNKSNAALIEASLAARVKQIDEQRAAEGKPPLEPRERDAVARQHAALEAHRCFAKDEFGDPVAFEFMLEGDTELTPAYLVFRAFQVLHSKLTAIAEAIRAGDATKVAIEPFPNRDDFYQAVITGEDHTIGNLLQGMLYRRWVRDGGAKEVAYIGYYHPHPLDNDIVVKIKCAIAGDDATARLLDGVSWVADRIDEIMAEWVSFAGLDAASDGARLVVVAEYLLKKSRRNKGTAAEVVVSSSAKAR